VHDDVIICARNWIVVNALVVEKYGVAASFQDRGTGFDE